MKILAKVLSVAGVLCFFSAAGNDDLKGFDYSIGNLFATVSFGFLLIACGALIYMRCEK